MRLTNHWILGNYDIQTLIVLFISVGLFGLGLISVITNGIVFFYSLLLKKEFLITHFVDFLLSFPTTACFIAYYFILLFFKKAYNKLVAYSFTFYTLGFYTIHSIYSIKPYIVMIFCFTLLFCADTKKLGVVFFLWLIIIIAALKVIFPDKLAIIEVAEEDRNVLLLILVIVLSGLFLGTLWLVAAIYKSLKNKATKKPLSIFCQQHNITRKEKSVILLVNAELQNKEIAFKMNIAESTVKKHLQSIFTKLCISNRVGIVKKLQNIDTLS